MILHFFELKKLPDVINAENMLQLWLALFKADTQEELDKIKAMKEPVMEKAINAYYTITAESEFRERERLLENARHNEASALRYEREKTTIEIAKNLIKIDVPIEKIISATGLKREEIENLCKINK